MDKIILERMEFYGYHGVFAEENKLGQRFYVDLTAYLDIKPAALSENVNDTVNYVEVFELIRDIVEGKPFVLLETLAEQIASQVLGNFTKINEVQVRVIKPHPPVDIHFGGVVIEIQRKRA